MIQQIYVALLNEGVDVWRPVEAECIHDLVFRILDQTYDQTDEEWQFGPGTIVECRKETKDRNEIIKAVRALSSS